MTYSATIFGCITETRMYISRRKCEVVLAVAKSSLGC